MSSIFKFPYLLTSYEEYKGKVIVSSRELKGTIYTKNILETGSILIFARLVSDCDLPIDKYWHQMQGPEDSFVIRPILNGDGDNTVSFSIPSTNGGEIILKTKSTEWVRPSNYD